MSSASPKKGNYRMRSEEDHVRRSVDIFDRIKNSSEKSHGEARYSCVTENSKTHKRA